MLSSEVPTIEVKDNKLTVNSKDMDSTHSIVNFQFFDFEFLANTFEDKILTCKKCEKEFIWSAAEQKFFKEKGFFRPSMCKDCRASIKTINNFRK